MEKRNKKVIVAMSGGVDSSVAVALLKKEGFNVAGVFMKFWGTGKCCTPESEKRARLVCEKLGIPFYVFNFQKEFKKKVVDYFSKQEKAGLTPNPCVVCNKEIKFGLLFKKALSLDADYIATGHYAIYKNGKLYKGKDKDKDQSYFLWKLNQKVLKHVLFPVGDYTKPEIVKLAKKFKLPVSGLKESQDICFKVDFNKKPGPIVLCSGTNYGVNKIIGQHNGLWFYTIGQRKGIGLAGGPYYVLSKDMKKNILVVTKKEKDLYKKELSVKNINWVSEKPELPVKVMVKIRYRHKPALAKFDGKKITFNKPQRAITPGQSAVFYHSQELIGGGIII